MGKSNWMANAGMYVADTYESITLSTATGTGFTAITIPNNVMRAFISVESTSSCRYRYDGGVPTHTGDGHQLFGGDVVSIIGTSNITNFLAIATSAGAATIKVTYEKSL